MPDLPPLARAVQELNFLTTVLHGRPGGTAPPASPDKTSDVTILSGFLGAGKTTLLRRILTGHHGRRLGVIVNDFGAVNLDAAEIAQDHGEVVELTNGCSCCAMGGDFVSAFERTANTDPPPDHILVEASGLSDPVGLATLAAGSRFSGAVGIVTLVDAQTLDLSTDGPLAALFTRQIDAAHLIVLTKTARLDEAIVADLIARLAARFAGRRIIADRDLDPAMAFAAPALGARPSPVQSRHDLSSVTTRQIAPVRRWNWTELEHHLGQLPAGILRVKGWVPDAGGALVGIQGVGRAGRLSPSDNPANRLGLVVIGLRECEAAWAGWLAEFERVQTL